MEIKEFVLHALKEDVGRGDLFEKTTGSKFIEGVVLTKEDGIFCGALYIKTLLDLFSVNYIFEFNDGDKISKGDTLIKFRGDIRDILKLERTILNILQHSSGIATNVAKYKKEIEDLNVILLDTRKTRPHLRVFEKYSTNIGGATNHRFGLDDCLMLKDTHLSCIEDLDSFVKNARKKIPFCTKIEIEIDSLDLAKKAFSVGADIVMCDNLDIETIKSIVDFRNKNYPNIFLEASGNINLKNIRDFGLSGVEAISSGSLIHNAVWLDFSMKIRS